MALPTIPSFSAGQKLRGSTLQTLSDALTWMTVRKGTRLRRAANQSINNSSVDTISWDTEDQDSDGFIAVTATTITIPTGLDGLWVAVVTGTSSGSAAATRKFVQIAPTSAITGVPSAIRGNGGAGESDCSAAGIFPLVGGNTLICQAFHNTGSAQNWTFTFNMYRMNE